MSDIFELNKQRIDNRIEKGLAMLKQHYTLKERAVPKEFQILKIQHLLFEIQQFEIEQVGNLLIMKCKETPQLQMDTFTLMPYFKNLPLFTTDYMYTGQKRSYLNEIYSLVDYQDDFYLSYIEKFRQNKEKHASLPDMPVKPCWYDEIRPVCTAKTTTPDADEENLEIFLENLNVFIEMEQNTPVFADEEAYQKKWLQNKAYADRLVDDGGVSTDVFKQVLGTEKTKAFFSQIFFAPDLYKK
ncbi:MAG: bilin reductase [Oscillospiraceae bacterium]|nr:bilin reductase [Oscillospiraceae bacterium]